jgi:hypothetical protein
VRFVALFLSTIIGAKAVKRIVNGQLVIEKNGKTYTALGQML